MHIHSLSRRDSRARGFVVIDWQLRSQEAAKIRPNPSATFLQWHRRASLVGRNAAVACDEYAVAVSGNWRLTFKFDGEHAIDVNLEDYH